MKIIKFVAYLFYRYYLKGPRREIPYFSTLSALTLLLYIHICQILVLFDWTNILPKAKKTEPIGWVAMALFMLPIFLLVRLVIKEGDLKKIEYSPKKIKRGNILLIGYCVLSVTLLILLILFKKGKL